MAFNIDIGYLRSLEDLPHNEKVYRSAQYYASIGARIVPQNGKIPLIEEWTDAASGDGATIDRWYGPGGQFEGKNVSLLIEGYSVVDVDRHEGRPDGFKTLGDVMNLAACPRQSTPHNGKHYLVLDSNLKPMDGVDILGERRLFTAWPSVVDGKQYRWESGGEPQRLPAKASLKLSGRKLESVKTKTDAPARPAVLPPAPRAYVEELLEHCDPDCSYDTWLKTGMAIHYNDFGDEGLEIFDTWSQGGSKYKKGECKAKWDTFGVDRGKPITLRWLLFEARDNGRLPNPRADQMYCGGNVETDLEILNVNKDFAVYDNGGTMVVVRVGRLHNKTKLFSYSVPSFQLKLADQPKVMYNGKLIPLADCWLQHPERRVVHEIGMWNLGKEPPGSINLYQGLAVPPVECDESDLVMFLTYVKKTLCRGNEKYADYLLDMLAQKVQDPTGLMGTALILQGEEGTGKTSLSKVMMAIFGHHFVAVSERDNLVGKFAGGLLAGALVVAADEAFWSGNHEESDRLKAMITEGQIDFQDKNVKTWQQKNSMFLMMTTNNDWAVPAGDKSRRYFVLRVADDRIGDERFWNEFYRRLGTDDHGNPHDPVYLGKLIYFLQHRKITSNTKKAMETEWLTEQRKETSIDSRESAFISWVRETFCRDLATDIIVGAGGQSIVRVEVDGMPYIRMESVAPDYRDYASNRLKKRRSAYDPAKFNSHLWKLGIETKKVRKHKVTMGGRPMEKEPTETKIVVASLPTPEQIEAKINEHFPLFVEVYQEED